MTPMLRALSRKPKTTSAGGRFGAAAEFLVPRWTAIRAANLGSKPNNMVLLTM